MYQADTVTDKASSSQLILIHARIRIAAETVRRVQGESYGIDMIVIDDESREDMSETGSIR